MSEDRIKKAVVTNAHVAVERIMQAIREDGNPSMNVAHVLGETAFIVGLDVALSVAITDVAAARKLMQWIATEVQENDPESTSERDRVAGELLGALGFEHD